MVVNNFYRREKVEDYIEYKETGVFMDHMEQPLAF